MSLAATCAALAVAVASWPPPIAALRARCDRSAPRRVPIPVRVTWGWGRPPAGWLVVPLAGAGAVLAGIGGAVAAALATVTVLRVRRRAVAARARATATGGLADALASFAAEVRVGAPLPAAAEAAGADAHALAERVFARVGATARLGGDVPEALRALARGGEDGSAGDHLERLAGAWALADRHGVALAGPVAAVAADLRSRARLAGRLDAQLAGPRATAAVLAALPVLGILMGEGIGARPWSVLSQTALGQVLLVVGAGLVCAGVAWTARITARVVR